MNEGTLIAVNNQLYEYVKWNEDFKVHEVVAVEIDDEGIITATYIHSYMTPSKMDNRGINLTEKQWIGLVSYFLRNDYDLTEEEITEAAEDIVCRCFVTTRPPLVEELPNYIADYMDR